MYVKTGIVLALLSVMIFAATDALAAGPVDVKAELGVQSKYVWRGYLQTDGPVLQPSVAVGLKGLNLGLWGTMDLSDESTTDTIKAMETKEARFSLGYDRSIAVLNMSAGVIHYTYPYKAYKTATTEIYAHAGGSVPGHPSITVYKDVDETKGLYGEITASQTIPVGLVLGIELSGGIGIGSKNFNDFYFNTDLKALPEKISDKKELKDDFTLSDIRFGIGAPIGIGNLVKIKPSVTYTGIINSAISDNLKTADIEGQNVFFGITASVSF